jgi:hypothetical protein
MLRRNLLCRFAPMMLVGLVAAVPTIVRGAVTAQGVALNAAASCSNADLDLTLTTVNATREFGLSTNLAGTTLNTFEQMTQLPNFSGTFVDYKVSPLPLQPTGTLIGSYAYVGTTPPTAATTGEFFVYYNCTTLQVLLSCVGPYGTCPQTAQQAQAQQNTIPALAPWGLAIAMLLLAGSGCATLRRRR